MMTRSTMIRRGRNSLCTVMVLRWRPASVMREKGHATQVVAAQQLFSSEQLIGAGGDEKR